MFATYFIILIILILGGWAMWRLVFKDLIEEKEQKEADLEADRLAEQALREDNETSAALELRVARLKRLSGKLDNLVQTEKVAQRATEIAQRVVELENNIAELDAIASAAVKSKDEPVE